MCTYDRYKLYSRYNYSFQDGSYIQNVFISRIYITGIYCIPLVYFCLIVYKYIAYFPHTLTGQKYLNTIKYPFTDCSIYRTNIQLGVKWELKDTGIKTLLY